MTATLARALESRQRKNLSRGTRKRCANADCRRSFICPRRADGRPGLTKNCPMCQAKSAEAQRQRKLKKPIGPRIRPVALTAVMTPYEQQQMDEIEPLCVTPLQWLDVINHALKFA